MAAFRAPVENELRALYYLSAFAKVNHEAALRVCADQKEFHAVSRMHLILLLKSAKIGPPLAAFGAGLICVPRTCELPFDMPEHSDSTSAGGNAGLRDRPVAPSLQNLSARTGSRRIVHLDPPGAVCLRPSAS